MNATVKAAGKELPTVQSVFDELAKAGVEAQQRSLAFGDTADSQVESIKARIAAVDKAITTLLTGGTDEVVKATDARIVYLTTRSAELKKELDARTAEIAAATAREERLAARRAEQDRRARQGTQGGSNAGVEAFAREQAALAAEQAAQDNLNERHAALVREDLDAARAASAEIEQNFDAAGKALRSAIDLAQTAARATRAGSQRAFFGDQARANNDAGQRQLFEAARLARDAALATAKAEEALAARREALIKGLDNHTAAMDRNLTAADALATQERGIALERERQAQSGAGRQGGSQAGGTGGTGGAGFQGIRELQARLIALRNAGVDPTSAAVAALVQQINALNLAAALDDLRENGVRALSDFSRQVLITNGVLQDTTKQEALAKATSEIGAEFAQAEAEAAAFGTQNELAAAKADILRGALQNLFGQGFKPTDDELQDLIAQYQHWIDLQREATNRVNAYTAALAELGKGLSQSADSFAATAATLLTLDDAVSAGIISATDAEAEKLTSLASLIAQASNLIVSGFAELVTNADTTAEGVARAFVRMGLQVVESVLQQLIALEALAVAQALIDGGTGNIPGLIALTAAAVVIGLLIAKLGGTPASAPPRRARTRPRRTRTPPPAPAPPARPAAASRSGSPSSTSAKAKLPTSSSRQVTACSSPATNSSSSRASQPAGVAAASPGRTPDESRPAHPRPRERLDDARARRQAERRARSVRRRRREPHRAHRQLHQADREPRHNLRLEPHPHRHHAPAAHRRDPLGGNTQRQHRKHRPSRRGRHRPVRPSAPRRRHPVHQRPRW